MYINRTVSCYYKTKLKSLQQYSITYNISVQQHTDYNYDNKTSTQKVLILKTDCSDANTEFLHKHLATKVI